MREKGDSGIGAVKRALPAETSYGQIKVQCCHTCINVILTLIKQAISTRAILLWTIHVLGGLLVVTDHAALFLQVVAALVHRQLAWFADSQTGAAAARDGAAAQLPSSSVFADEVQLSAWLVPSCSSCNVR